MLQNTGSLAATDFPHESTILGAIRTVRHEVAAIGPDHLDAVVQLIAERAQSLTGATGAAIALKRDDVLVCLARSGLHAPDLGVKLQLGAGFSGQCVRSGRSLRCEDALIDSRVDFEVCNVLGVRSIVAVPIKQDNRVTGLVEIFSPVARKFLGSDEIMLEELAELVAFAIAAPRLGSPTSQSSRQAEKNKCGFEPKVPAQGKGESVVSILPRALRTGSESTRRLIRISVGILIVTVGGSVLGVSIRRLFLGSDRAVGGSTRYGEANSATAQTTAGPIPTYPSDLKRIRELAEQGQAAAQFALGAKYAIGDEVKQDYAEAARWFTEASEHGHSMAQSVLSAYYWQGRGVQRDLTKAYFWSLVAQASGDQFGKERVAFLASQLSQSQLAAVKAEADVWITEHKAKK